MTELLIDSHGPLVLHLEEAAEGNGKIIMRGQFARSDKATENKRFYKESLWRREFARMAENISNRQVYGELDHPSDGRTKLQRVSHLVTELRIEGNEVIGAAEVLDTPNGRILATLARAKAAVGVSSRGYGSTKQLPDGTMEVQEDFKLDTFDFVADPATKGAYPQMYAEERQHIQEAEVLTLEILKKDYPGLVEELNVQGVGSLTENTGAAVAAAEARTEERLTEQFAEQLRRGIEVIEDEIRVEVRSDLMSDPETAGARQVLENVVSMVKSYGIDPQAREELMVKDDEVTQLQAKLSERELEVQKAQAQAEEMKKLAFEAAMLLKLERIVGGDPAREAIEALLGDVTSLKSVSEIQEKVTAIKDELDRRGGPEPTEGEQKETATSEKVEALEAKLEAAKADLEKAQKGRETATGRANKAEQTAHKALEVAEGLEIQLHVEQQLHDRTSIERTDIRKLTEDVSTLDEADKLIEGYEPATPDDQQVSRIRLAASRGKERDIGSDTHGVFGGDGLKEVGSKKDAGGSNGKGGSLLEEIGGGNDKTFSKLAGTKK